MHLPTLDAPSDRVGRHIQCAGRQIGQLRLGENGGGNFPDSDPRFFGEFMAASFNELRGVADAVCIPGTAIESSKYNSTIDDMIADLNLPRPIVAGGTGQAEGVVDALTESELVTKSDLETGLAYLRTDIYRAMLVQTGTLIGALQHHWWRLEVRPDFRRGWQA